MPSPPAHPRPGFQRVFIANRGEVAVRVARTLDSLGITPVFAASTADRDAAYLEGREVVTVGPGRPGDSYLDPMRLVQGAVQSGCTALHPGWGFLAENPRFAALSETHGVTFIGPPAHVMHLMGKKTPAKRAMRQAGLQVIPGSDGIVSGLDEARAVAADVGFPVLIKAESGGGGRGMRVARADDELEDAFEDAQKEALAAFGDPRVYLEKLIERGRHVEIQLLADRYGRAVHLGERDCTVQRNHQKLIEESPAPGLDAARVRATATAAARAAAEIGYVGAGTMELLLDDTGTLRFMEMNTRLQVEHTVTEERVGLDLVEQQLRVAAGHRLDLDQGAVELTGHAIECRINAEDPEDDFRPHPGRITAWKLPSGPGIRVDSHVSEGYDVPPFYDSLIAKVIATSATRAEAIERMLTALRAFRVEGIPTTIGMHQTILQSAAFQTNAYDTRGIPGWPPASLRKGK